ncbi:MAG: nucleotide exchange factor GrpE [Bacteroidaceae bacterium]|nr:nucleotide exchange factor GrpE [Bacteroidaceae bacterium]
MSKQEQDLKEEEKLNAENAEQATENTETVENNSEEEQAEEAPAEKTTEEKLADALAEIEELKTKQLYKQAEFENFRRRVISEKAELILNGGRKVLEAMLPVVDDMERALAHMDKAEDVQAVKDGVDLIYKKFLSTLKAQGVTPMEAQGADFNTDFHEAVTQFPAPTDDLKGKVIDCTEKGYMINDKVLRYAKVVVGI